MHVNRENYIFIKIILNFETLLLLLNKTNIYLFPQVIFTKNYTLY